MTANQSRQIGSEQVGQKVALKGAEVGTPVLLELGGKASLDFLAPSALSLTRCAPGPLHHPPLSRHQVLRRYMDASRLVRASFPGCIAPRLTSCFNSQACGQNCIGVERFLVHSSIYDSFVTDMTARVADLKAGDVLAHAGPEDKSRRVDVGAMVTDRLFDDLEELIAEAVEDGARCLVGGKRFVNEEMPHGHYFSPTLLVDVWVLLCRLFSGTGAELVYSQLSSHAHCPAGNFCTCYDRPQVFDS